MRKKKGERKNVRSRIQKKQLLNNKEILKFLQGLQITVNRKGSTELSKGDVEKLGNIISWIDKNKQLVHHAAFVETKNLMINLKFYSECMASDLGKIIEMMDMVERFEHEVKKKEKDDLHNK